MKKNALSPESIYGLRQGFADFTENHMFTVRNARRVRGNLLVEYENLAPWHHGTHMIIRPAIAEAEFENDTAVVADSPRGIVETGALSLQPSDSAF